MLPFANKTDLEEARKSADVSMDRHSSFLESLLEEHERADAREQLKTAWTNWLERFNEAPEPSAAGHVAAGGTSLGRAPTPPG